MERIVYRKTLDVHKNGIQFTLQGFETADNMSRKIEISLMASGDTMDFPLEQIMAVAYVTTPNASEPSINECTIKDNTIIYDVMPIVEEGITEVQIKLIDTRPEGANGVLPTPRFAIEVSKSNTNDESVTQTTTYTALENALAMAKGVYDARLVRMEIDDECVFRVHYADGTTYETDILRETLLKEEALMSKSYARGGTGIRAGENKDNSMYYSNVSKSASAEASNTMGVAADLLEEVRKHGVYSSFSVDFDSGEVEYISPNFTFEINQSTGELEVIGNTYTNETFAKISGMGKELDANYPLNLIESSAKVERISDYSIVLALVDLTVTIGTSRVTGEKIPIFLTKYFDMWRGYIHFNFNGEYKHGVLLFGEMTMNGEPDFLYYLNVEVEGAASVTYEIASIRGIC